ncbi:MAG: ATP phosphoribosyltransferase regulatory subunit, partial [Spirochaetales bacterium]|nr:ATP phosphoribosyltransferase regulatory subunit [Spirochaetales bacterium]
PLARRAARAPPARLGAVLDASLEASLVHLEGLWRELEELGVSRLFRIDLSETASQPYYTGVVFQAYREGIDSAFASGGRYDRLLSCFGFDAPAVGFSLMLRKVESCLRNFQVPQKRDCAVVRGLRFAEVFRKAEGLRSSSGRPVVMGEGANEGS